MTLQDYLNLTRDSINNFFSGFGPNLANILAAIVILAVGILVGSILKRVWEEILNALNLEKTLTGWSTYQKLVKSHDNLDLTNYVGELLRWLSIAVFLIPAVTALGIVGASDVLDTLIAYLPNVVLASLFLVLGFVFSWFVHRAVMAISALVGLEASHLVADIPALAVIIFALTSALLQLGLPMDLLRLSIIGVIAASALAFGLAGKEQAAILVKKFMDRASG